MDRVTFKHKTAFKELDLKLNEHAKRLEAGKVYDIVVRSNGFEPDVQIADGSKVVLTKMNYGVRAAASGTLKFFADLGLANRKFETALRFAPSKTGDFRILVGVSPYAAARQPLHYTIHVTEPKVDLAVSGRLAPGDPLYPRAGPFKSHTVKLTVGKNYQIDLVTAAFDSYLLLEDSAGKLVMKGFDVEGFNSRIVFRPTRTATYRIIASSHQAEARGTYVVTVAENATAVPRMPRTGN